MPDPGTPARADWQQAAAVPVNTYQNRRSEQEIEEQLAKSDQLTGEGRLAPGIATAEYAAGVGDTIAWLFGMAGKKPLS
jgi:hypothetical protein